MFPATPITLNSQVNPAILACRRPKTVVNTAHWLNGPATTDRGGKLVRQSLQTQATEQLASAELPPFDFIPSTDNTKRFQYRLNHFLQQTTSADLGTAVSGKQLLEFILREHALAEDILARQELPLALLAEIESVAIPEKLLISYAKTKEIPYNTLYAFLREGHAQGFVYFFHQPPTTHQHHGGYDYPDTFSQTKHQTWIGLPQRVQEIIRQSVTEEAQARHSEIKTAEIEEIAIEAIQKQQKTFRKALNIFLKQMSKLSEKGNVSEEAQEYLVMLAQQSIQSGLLNTDQVPKTLAEKQNNTIASGTIIGSIPGTLLALQDASQGEPYEKATTKLLGYAIAAGILEPETVEPSMLFNPFAINALLTV